MNISAGEAVDRIARKAEPRFAKTFYTSMKDLRRYITEEDVTLALGENPAALYGLLESSVILKEFRGGEEVGAYAEVVSDAVQAVIKVVAGQLGEIVAEFALRFDISSPYVTRSAQTLAAEAIREVTQESKRAVRRVILQSVRDGISPKAATERIREIVGLTERQALAVTNFRNGLEQVVAGSASRSILENRWALTRYMDLPRDINLASIDTLVERYAERLLRSRAMNIARTETLRASNAGQQLLWEDLARANIIDGSSFQRQWLTAEDERVCPRCAPMEGKTVGLKQQFQETQRGVLPSQRQDVAGESVLTPPLHPQCRCTLVAVF